MGASQESFTVHQLPIRSIYHAESIKNGVCSCSPIFCRERWEYLASETGEGKNHEEHVSKAKTEKAEHHSDRKEHAGKANKHAEGHKHTGKSNDQPGSHEHTGKSDDHNGEGEGVHSDKGKNEGKHAESNDKD